jgi:hypothetical protein
VLEMLSASALGPTREGPESEGRAMPDNMDDGLPTPAEDLAGEQLPLVEAETVLTRPPSRRKRLVQLSLVLVAGIVALVTFRSALFPQRALPQPTPTFGLQVLSSALLIQSNLTYGTVTVNGRRHQEAPPFFVPLTGETYDLTLAAPPFRPVACQVTLPSPPAPGTPVTFFRVDHCIVARYATGLGLKGLHGVSADPAALITITVTDADLPADQAAQVTTLLAQSLATEQTTTVPTGEYIAASASPDGVITSQRASEPLQASAFLAPSMASRPSPFCGKLLCPLSLNPYFLPPDTAIPTSPELAVAVPLGLRWRFTNTAGKVIADVSFPVTSAIVLFLAPDAKAGWQISQQEIVPGFATIHDQQSASLCLIGNFLLQQRQPTASVGLLHDHGVAGCELSLQQPDPAQPQTLLDLGNVIWRFGVLLAAGDKAHALLPDLPIASAEAIAAVGG